MVKFESWNSCSPKYVGWYRVKYPKGATPWQLPPQSYSHWGGKGWSGVVQRGADYETVTRAIRKRLDTSTFSLQWEGKPLVQPPPKLFLKADNLNPFQTA